MNGRKRRTTIHNSDQDFTIHAKSFVFFDKKTGTRRFEVEANANGSMPVNHVASLLALHCVTRGRTPRDFDVVVEADEDLFSELGKNAEKFIQDCQMSPSSDRLTRRQQEVLTGVLQNLSNKEIAGRVNLSVPTVKFHISALLRKFAVANRMGLMQKAVDLFPQEKSSNESPIPILMGDPRLRNGQRSGKGGGGLKRMNGLERRSCS
jgi:DNA-binding CsgD family transcriptional regulator